MSDAGKTQALDELNALHLASSAHGVHRVSDARQLESVIDLGRRTSRQIITLGDGTNVVLGERLHAIVLLMRNQGCSLVEDGESRLLTAAAGENWHGVVRFALAQGAYGIENLALIPGRVGAAPIQNIGAYGLELSDVFESLEAIHRDTGEARRFRRDECAFGYRTSLFKRAAHNPWIIWQVTLRLQSRPHPRTDYRDLSLELQRLGVKADLASPIDVAEAVVRVRRRKLPDVRHTPNVGSFFKNPIIHRDKADILRQQIPDLVAWPIAGTQQTKLSAAQLIDRAGLKGLAKGGARIWWRQPLVLINESANSRREFLQLAELVRTEVRSRWHIELEFEPDFYPG